MNHTTILSAIRTIARRISARLVLLLVIVLLSLSLTACIDGGGNPYGGVGSECTTINANYPPDHPLRGNCQ